LGASLAGCAHHSDPPAPAAATTTASTQPKGLGGHRSTLDPADDPSQPHYNDVFRKATHNSYWLDVKGSPYDLEASGVHERPLDQLLFEHVRALELDLHYESGHPGEFTVYHTDQATSNSACHYLYDCLELLQRMDVVQPNHEVVNVILEFKENIPNRTFGNNGIPGVERQNHHWQDLDRQLWEHLGSRIYTPREFLQGCPDGSTLTACAAYRTSKGVSAWPTVDELRGRYIVNVIGNWADNYWDWMEYATADGGIIQRAAFPLRSMLANNPDTMNCPTTTDNFNDILSGKLKDHSSYHPEIELNTSGLCLSGDHPYIWPQLDDPTFQQSLATARAQSVFWQVENTAFNSTDTNANSTGYVTGPFRANGGVMRSAGGAGDNDVSASLASWMVFGNSPPPATQYWPAAAPGYQLIQTDFPWHLLPDLSNAIPIVLRPETIQRPFFEPFDVAWAAPDPTKVTRLYDPTALLEPGVRLFMTNGSAFGPARGNSDTWTFQATSTTATHDGKTELSPLGMPDGHGCFEAKSSSNGALQFAICRHAIAYDESRSIEITAYTGTTAGAKSSTKVVPHQEPSPTDVGDLISVTVTRSGGQSTIAVQTAGWIDPNGQPHWNAWPDGNFTVDADLDMQGFYAINSALFTGATHNGSPVALSDLPQVSGTVADISFCGADGTACAPRTYHAPDTQTGADGASYVLVHEAYGKVFDGQDRHLYTLDRYEALSGGLVLGFVDSKFALRATPADDGNWLPVYRCTDWRRDLHVYWLSTSPDCKLSNEDSGQPSQPLGYLSKVQGPNMQPLYHLIKGTENVTGPGTLTDEHDTYDHYFALGESDRAGAKSQYGYVDYELLGYVPLPLDVAIDATALTDQTLAVGGVTDYFSSKTIKRVQLGAGTYQLYLAAQGVPVNFTVTAGGTLDYDPSLDGTFTGRGTTTLKLKAYTVGIDARKLTKQAVAVGYVTDYLDTTVVQHVQLAPGPYGVYLNAQGTILGVFTVGPDGNVSYDASLASTFDGAGSPTLVLKAYAVSIDGRALTKQGIAVGYVTDYFSSDTVQTVNLAPGPYGMYVAAQGTLLGVFNVKGDDTVDYDPSLEGVFSKSGPTLILDAYAVSIDGAQLTKQGIAVGYVTDYFSSDATQTVNLAPGPYGMYVAAQGTLLGVFNVTKTGKIDYDAALDPLFQGKGTPTLHLRGYAVSVDGTALTKQGIAVGYVTDYFSSDAAQTVNLAPGPYGMYVAAQGTLLGVFTVKTDGTLAYDPSLEPIFSLKTPTTLALDAYPVTIDGRAMTKQGIAVGYVTDYFSSDAEQAVNLAPGPYGMYVAAQGTLLGIFNVTTAGTISYDPSLETAFLTENPTTLGLRAYGISINGQALPEQPIAVGYVTDYFDSMTIESVMLPPGPYGMYDATHLVGIFSVSANDSVTYDGSLAGTFGGTGTATLDLLNIPTTAARKAPLATELAAAKVSPLALSETRAPLPAATAPPLPARDLPAQSAPVLPSRPVTSIAKGAHPIAP
jgi:hypothetical protein